MADYTIISDISNYLVQLLRAKMCPELIPSPGDIEVSSPGDQAADYILGLYLYDIQEEGEISLPSLTGTGKTRLRRPPRPYSLYYMLFPNSSSQRELKGGDAQKLIGRAAQIINDGNMVDPRRLQTWLESEEPPVLFSPAKLSLEDKVRVWSAVNKPYQVSLFYKACPVLLSSEVVVDSPRVTDAQFGISVMRARQKGGQA